MPEKTVTALLRGLTILEIANAYSPVGLSTVQRQTGLPKATTLRLLETLRTGGYLTFDEQTRTYSPSLRALALAANVSYDIELVRIARPVLEKLRPKLIWPSDLAIFQHDKMVIVDTNRSPGLLSSNRSIGSRIPFMASATGRVYLANIRENQRHALLEQLQTSDDPFEAMARDKAATDAMVAETRERGYALSNQEFLQANRGAAVAVKYEDTVVCVINLIVVAALVSIEEVEERFVPLLFEAKAELEQVFGQLMLSKTPQAAK